jgi:metal-responsive CopG/Arc/MetJ family transcriptional regulator
MRKNINITLDENLVKQIDEDISKDVFRSRSHAIQKMVRKFYMQQEI